jgi:hypothetical protein
VAFKHKKSKLVGAKASHPRPEITPDRDEVIVCMVLAFCISNAMISLIYKLMA